MEKPELLKVNLLMEPYLYQFYQKLGQQAGLPPEQVMTDALFRFAGEASLQALDKKKRER